MKIGIEIAKNILLFPKQFFHLLLAALLITILTVVLHVV